MSIPTDFSAEIKQSIKERVEPFELGKIVAHPNVALTHELIGYADDGAIAVVESKGRIERWPENEIFDPKEVLRIWRDNFDATAQKFIDKAGEN